MKQCLSELFCLFLSNIIIVVQLSSKPHTAVEGRLPETTSYRNIIRNPNAEIDEGISIFRMDASLYFANVAHFKEKVKEATKSRLPLQALILNFFPVNRIDSSAAHVLEELILEFHKQNTRVLFVGVKGPVRDVLERAHLDTLIGEDNFFLEVHEAVRNVWESRSETFNTPQETTLVI